MTSEKNSARRAKRSFVACHRCHSHKIKCSGGTPCSSCKANNNDVNCVYPSRERKITVSESYLKRLQKDAEMASTYQRPGTADNHVSVRARQQPPDELRPGEVDDIDVSNPLFDVPSLDQKDARSLEPSFTGEAACSAFGDRLLRCINKNYRPSLTSSFPYFQDRTLRRLFSRNYDLPDRIEAKLLIQIASKFVGNDQHLYLRKTFLEELDAVYQNEAQPNTPWICKLFSLLALGEFYSHRKKSVDNYRIPGTGYHLRAISLLQDIYEDATVLQVETLILISCFANGLGRVKAAYTYTGIAMRLSLILGLHRAIPATSEISMVERENRRRIWWTLYHFDRVAASKLGFPITIRDEDIDVDLPSMNGLTPSEMEEFADPSHLVAKVGLAKITGNILTDIYGLPNRVEGTFVQRVHGILKKLRSWDHALPEEIRTCTEQSARHVASLHLAYNQLIITTTRPILLHIFRSQFQLGVKSTTPHQGFSTTTLALAEACVNAARTSSSILTRLYIDGSIATYGYLDAHHLFSATLILIMSAVMSPTIATSEAVQLSSNVLQAMKDYGNIPASDYCERISRLQSSVSDLRGEIEMNQALDVTVSTYDQDVQVNDSDPNETVSRPINGNLNAMSDPILGASPPRQPFRYPNFVGANGSMDVLAQPLIDDFLCGDWLAFSGEAFPEDDALRAVALELEDNRFPNS